MTIATTMQAWVCRRYGGPEALTCETVPLPALGVRDVLVRVQATTVSSADACVRALRMPPGFGLMGRLALGLKGPRRPILGTEAAGVVAAVGAEARRFRPGDRVIVFADMKMGCHAEYVAAGEDGLIIPMPTNLDLAEAASLCFGGTTALHFIRRAGLAPGERLLVVGACGTVGSAFVQLAKAMGAEVTALTSAGNMGLAKLLGADAVLDYGREDFTALGQSWDVIADTVAATRFIRCLPVLKEGGRYLTLAGGLVDLLARRKGTKRRIGGPARAKKEDLAELARRAAEGRFKPLIDQVYPFTEMRAAHGRVDGGHKRGSVVVRVP